jgi:hypothetical protein
MVSVPIARIFGHSIGLRLSDDDPSSVSMQCPRCGGRNPSGTAQCGFCASPLRATTAPRSASSHPALPAAWIMFVLIGLVLLSLIVLTRFVAQ